MEKLSFDFELGKPFKPFEQLMGVLPVASMVNIPLGYRVRAFKEYIYLLGVESTPGSHVRRELVNSGLLSPQIRAGFEWKKTILGSCREDPFYR